MSGYMAQRSKKEIGLQVETIKGWMEKVQKYL